MHTRRFLRNLLPSLTLSFLAVIGLSTESARAQGAGDLRFIDSGERRDFILAGDEIYVKRSVPAAGALRTEIEARIAGATVIEPTDLHAVIKLDHAFDSTKARTHTDEVSVAFADAQTFPVLYVKGMPQDKTSRRVFTTKILVALAVGVTPEQIGAQVGAVSARRAPEAGLAILELPTAHHVLEALAILAKAGIAANPMLGHAMEAKSLPKDRFFLDQWHLHNTGQSGSVFGIDANVLDAWNVTLGAGVTINIVDSSLETNHPDLAAHTPPVDTQLHHDFLDDDIDPNPHFGDNHGTSVAGVAAALQNNGSLDAQTGTLRGVSGSAPDTQILGVRLINESGFVPVTDDEEALALHWMPKLRGIGAPLDIVGVCNNSWGPSANAGLVGPDTLAKAALRDAAVNGRDGKGQVTLFAAGNGQRNGAESNTNGYANSRFVIAVGAITNLGVQSSYSENGANLLVSAPSNGGTLSIVTTDVTDVGGYNPPLPGIVELPDTNYTNSFGGTSSATPLTAGVAALLLSANPELGWRDVKEILAATANQVDPADPDWVNNGAGFKFNHKYGGGMVDASAAVIRALDWTNLPQERSQEVTVPSTQLPLTVPDDFGSNGLTIPFSFSGPNYPNIRVETVEVTVSITHARRSDLEIHLISPDGTDSMLFGGGIPRGNNTDFKNAVFTGTGIATQDEGWTFTSTHHWGEDSTGDWKVLVLDNLQGTVGTVEAATVRLFGTPSARQRFKFEQARYTVIEPDNAPGAAPRNLTINVERLGDPVGTVSVDYTTSPRGTATAEGPGVSEPDYSPIGGTILFGNGETEKQINIPILHDTKPEANETIYLLLKNPNGGSLGGVNLATVEIIDNDENRVSVAATDQTATEPTEGVPEDRGVFTISRTVPSPQDLVVHFTIAGTATPGLTPGADYVPVDFTATIPANETSTTVAIIPRDDTAIEGTETVDLTLISDPAYVLGVPTTAQVRILDNDRPRVQITAVPNILKENDPTRVAHLYITRTDDTSLPLAVLLSYDGNQVNGVNYRDAITKEALPEKVVIPAGQAFLDFTVEPINNSVYEPSKVAIIKLVPTPEYDFTFGFLSTATITILEDDPLPDPKIPKITLAAPKKASRILSPAAVTASGTASDNQLVTRVEYRVNGREWKAVPGIVAAASVNWSLTLNPTTASNPEVRFGLNTFEVRSVDNVGNRSATLTTTFLYVNEEKLTVNIAPPGAGTVTKGFAGETTRDANVSYTITATPAVGQVFKGWTGLVTSPSRTITFVMPSMAATLNAEFIVGPFVPAITGRYTGLALGGTFTFDSSAFVDLMVGPSGAFSGKLLLSGLTYPIKGEFSGQGLYHGQIARKNNFPLDVTLAMDLSATAAGTQRITGTIVASTFTLAVEANRAPFSKTSPAPTALVKNYTLLLPPNNPLGNQDFDPRGNGVGTVKIDAAGIVHAVGTLGDGTRFSLTQPLTKDLTWPLFLQPYKKRGVVVGVVTQDSAQAGSDFDGQFNWFKPSSPSDKYFPFGFTVKNSAILGSVYEFTGPRSLGGFSDGTSNGNVTLSDGNIVSPIVKVVTYDATNKITVTQVASDALALAVNAKAGTFSGSFVHPISLKKTTIQGVLFQKQQKGFGTFLGTSIPGIPLQTGKVTFAPKAQAQN